MNNDNTPKPDPHPCSGCRHFARLGGIVTGIPLCSHWAYAGGGCGPRMLGDKPWCGGEKREEKK